MTGFLLPRFMSAPSTRSGPASSALTGCGTDQAISRRRRTMRDTVASLIKLAWTICSFEASPSMDATPSLPSQNCKQKTGRHKIDPAFSGSLSPIDGAGYRRISAWVQYALGGADIAGADTQIFMNAHAESKCAMVKKSSCIRLGSYC